MTKTEQVRLGTVGTGSIVRSLLNNVVKTEGMSLEAVYSRSEEKGRQLAEEYGTERVYTDYDRFLKEADINTVYIASPNILHYEQSGKALLAGKNVICEKPFCTKASMGKELKELAAKKELCIVEAVPTAFLPNLEVLKQVLPEVGRIRLVMGNYSQYSGRYDILRTGGLPNVFNPEFGGGCLMDINYYNVYLNTALFGRPEDFDYYPNMHAGGVDTSGILILRYKDFISECTGAKDTRGVNYFQIEGENGYIYVEGGSNGLRSIRLVTQDRDEVIDRQPEPDRYYYEAAMLAELIRKGDDKILSEMLDLTLDVMEILEKARKKAGILFPGD